MTLNKQSHSIHVEGSQSAKTTRLVKIAIRRASPSRFAT